MRQYGLLTGALNVLSKRNKSDALEHFNKPVADFAERGVYAASMPPGKNYGEAG